MLPSDHLPFPMFHMTLVKYLQQVRNKMIQTLPPIKVILENISNTEQLHDVPQSNSLLLKYTFSGLIHGAAPLHR